MDPITLLSIFGIIAVVVLIGVLFTVRGLKQMNQCLKQINKVSVLVEEEDVKINDIAIEITKEEAGKTEVNIAQVKDVLRALEDYTKKQKEQGKLDKSLYQYLRQIGK